MNKQFGKLNGIARRGGLAAVLALGLAGFATLAAAHDPAHPPTTYRPMDLPELHGILEHVRQNAGPEQGAMLDALVATARPELHALSQRAMAAHQRKLTLMLAESPDRAALAQAQAEEIAAADALARGIDRALVGLTELLTPEQRAKFREHHAAHA